MFLDIDLIDRVTLTDLLRSAVKSNQAMKALEEMDVFAMGVIMYVLPELFLWLGDDVDTRLGLLLAWNTLVPDTLMKSSIWGWNIRN